MNPQEVTKEFKEELKKYLEANDNENTTTENQCDAVKAVLWGKSMAIQSYLKTPEKHQINDLALNLK